MGAGKADEKEINDRAKRNIKKIVMGFHYIYRPKMN
jgi:hypothetical protein